MSTGAHALHGEAINLPASPRVEIRQARRIFWLVKREMWEFRSIWIVPLAAAGIALIVFLSGAASLAAKMRAAMAMDVMQEHEAMLQPYDAASLLIMGVTFILALIYSVEALQGERRDRSILFWKSLPVSDWETVLSKASIPLLVLPLLTVAATIVTQAAMLALHMMILSGSGLSPSLLWNQLEPLKMWGLTFYHLLAFHSLWYAPFYGWLLLVSGWSRRLAFLWATVPLVALGLAERMAFNTTYFAMMLLHRLIGDAARSATHDGGSAAMGAGELTHFAPWQFFTSAGLWIGLGLTAAFLCGAVRLRRSREAN
jgi:ABC-2 type transport system permease protein